MPARLQNVGTIIALIILIVVIVLVAINQLDLRTALVIGGLAVAIILK